MSAALLRIGTIEAVSLPDYGVENILAKVDTGADSSAIWASNITETDGELSYTLFGPSTPSFTGEVIRTRKYSIVTVRNSFGQKENRYKVTLRLILADKIINVRITLANRSNNRFAILIGRRTLKGKFLVDAAKINSLLGTQRVLFLVATKNEVKSKFVDYAVSDGLSLKMSAYEDLVVYTGGGANSITISDSGEDISDFALTFFRTSTVFGHPYLASAIAKYLDYRNIDFIDRSVNYSSGIPKLYQYITLTDNNIPIPKTIFMMPSKLSQAYEKLMAELGTPFILKDTRGRIGQNNYLVKSKSDFDRALIQAQDLGVWLLAQQYVPNDCDYRFLVFGGQVALVFKRSRSSDDTHLNNISAGGKGELMDLSVLSTQLVNTAIASAKLLQLQIAGVDLIQDKLTKLWYCLEVNKTPEIYTGAFIDQKQAALTKYLSQRLNN